MSDIDIQISPLAVLLLTVPWPIGGAIIGAVAWRIALGRRWWIGAILGALLGALTLYVVIVY